MKSDILTPPGPAAAKRSRGGLYRTFVSIKTTLLFLFIFGGLFFIGTVFPQSSDPESLAQYREAGGRLVAVVGALGLLNLFHSWYFLLLAALFALHLFLCSIHRFNIIRRRPKYGLFSRGELLQSELSFSVTTSEGESGPGLEETLRALGFNKIKYYSENAQVKRVVAEKGIPFRWLSWAYHLCILLAIAGFCVSSLFAFEGYISVPVGGKKTLELDSADTNWTQLKRIFGWKAKGSPAHMEIELREFRTEYIEKPRLQYPEKPLQRLFSVWNIGPARLRYTLPKNSVVPRDWFSTVRIHYRGAPVKEKTIQVNDPLRYSGLTVYQIGYEHKFDLRAGDETLTGLVAGKPFGIPQMEGQFLLETPREGSVKTYEGEARQLTPSARLKYRPPAPPEDRRWIVAAELVPGVQAEAMRTPVTLLNLRESSVFSYRYDPGVPLLWIGTVLLLAFMGLRIYLPWYQVLCHADTMNQRTIITVSMRMVGLFARPERLRLRLCDALRK